MNTLIAGWRWRALFWSIALGMLGYLIFSLWGGWREVVAAIGRVGASGMAITLGLALINYGLRFVRWQGYLGALELSVPWRLSLRIYLAGFALTTTPGKAGEAIRALFLRPLGLSYTQGVAAFVSERLSDLLAIVVLAFFGFLAYPMLHDWLWVGVLGVGGFLGAVSNASLLESALRWAQRSESRLRRMVGQALRLLLETGRCHSPVIFAWASLLSLIGWAAEAWAFYLLASWLDCPVSLPQAFAIYALGMLVGALSFLPGGLGGTEAVMASLLITAGTGEPEAVAVTVLIRLSTLWFAIGLGLWAMVGLSQTKVREDDK